MRCDVILGAGWHEVKQVAVLTYLCVRCRLEGDDASFSLLVVIVVGVIIT